MMQMLLFLALPMLRLLSSKAQRCKYFWKPSKPCHVGTHWIALAKCSQMSTHMPGFQSFSSFLHRFEMAKLATSSIRVKASHCSLCHPLFLSNPTFSNQAIDLSAIHCSLGKQKVLKKYIAFYASNCFIMQTLFLSTWKHAKLCKQLQGISKRALPTLFHVKNDAYLKLIYCRFVSKIWKFHNSFAMNTFHHSLFNFKPWYDMQNYEHIISCRIKCFIHYFQKCTFLNKSKYHAI